MWEWPRILVEYADLWVRGRSCRKSELTHMSLAAERVCARQEAGSGGVKAGRESLSDSGVSGYARTRVLMRQLKRWRAMRVRQLNRQLNVFINSNVCPRHRGLPEDRAEKQQLYALQPWALLRNHQSILTNVPILAILRHAVVTAGTSGRECRISRVSRGCRVPDFLRVEYATS